jgi:hypothetical protein
MRFVTRRAAILIATLAPLSADAGGRAAPARDVPLSCTIRCAKTSYRSGEVPEISVRLFNWTGKDIFLVGSLDGSDCRIRYPHWDFEITGPDGQMLTEMPNRCGYMNPLRPEQFIKVAAGGAFDPYRQAQGLDFFGDWRLCPETFRRAGDYRVRFVYSTEQPRIARWLGSSRHAEADLREDSPLSRLLAEVPKTTVRSNELRIVIKGREGDERGTGRPVGSPPRSAGATEPADGVRREAD